jgi:MOSC domain-containing protein
VHVSRIGYASVKGTRHLSRPDVELTADGPRGDRLFCLVDRARDRVLRTVENRRLLATSADWDGRVLTASLRDTTADTTVSGVPEPTGEKLELDYWGRPALVEVLAGPWAAAYSAFLGTDVALVRAARPGEVVYGAPVSLVTTSSLERLAQEAGGPVDDAQLRATFTVDTTGEPPHVEDGWSGRRLRIGEAEVEVRGGLPRCAVVDLDPATGEPRLDVLRALGGYRRVLAEVVFGVDAVVTRPGRVFVDDVVGRG